MLGNKNLIFSYILLYNISRKLATSVRYSSDEILSFCSSALHCVNTTPFFPVATVALRHRFLWVAFSTGWECWCPQCLTMPASGGSNPPRSTTILLLCMGYSPETTSSVIPGSRCNVFRFFTLQRATAQLSRVYHRLQRSGSCTSKDVGIGANPKSVTICGFLLGGKTTLLVPTAN